MPATLTRPLAPSAGSALSTTGASASPQAAAKSAAANMKYVRLSIRLYLIEERVDRLFGDRFVE